MSRRRTEAEQDHFRGTRGQRGQRGTAGAFLRNFLARATPSPMREAAHCAASTTPEPLLSSTSDCFCGCSSRELEQWHERAQQRRARKTAGRRNAIAACAAKFARGAPLPSTGSLAGDHDHWRAVERGRAPPPIIPHPHDIASISRVRQTTEHGSRRRGLARARRAWIVIGDELRYGGSCGHSRDIEILAVGWS